MRYSLKIVDSAKAELREAAEWYEIEQVGLGERFLSEFENCLTLIAQEPKLFARRKKDYREILIKPFPFLLVYRIDKEARRIVITAVFHTKRNPKKKYR